MARNITLLAIHLAALICPSHALAQADPVAAAEIRHLREMIAANDRYYQAQFEAQKQAVAVALANAREAGTKADTASDKRLDGMNEFRGTLKDQQSTYVTRAELGGWLVGAVGAVFAMLSLLGRRGFKKDAE